MKRFLACNQFIHLIVNTIAAASGSSSSQEPQQPLVQVLVSGQQLNSIIFIVLMINENSFVKYVLQLKTVLVLYMSFDKFILAVESRDLISSWQNSYYSVFFPKAECWVFFNDKICNYTK